MWLFAAISLAIATPCFRSWLEALFAELSIIFFTYLQLVSVSLVFIFLLALGFHGRRFLRNRPMASTPRHEDASAVKTALAHVQWKCGKKQRALMLRVKSTTSEVAGSGFYPPQLWTSSLVVLAMLPIMSSVMIGGRGGEEAQHSVNLRILKSETAAAAETIFDADSAALVALQQHLTTCKYSGGNACVDDVTSISVLGEYRRATNYCTTFDAAYVNVSAGAALPAQFFPIEVEEANAQGFANNFFAWSDTNREKFQMDCPLLYNETVIGEGQELLCCTETQYEMLSLQVRELPGQCTSCKDNLRNLWCQFTCHPSNSLFVDVTQVRLMGGDSDHADEVFPAIEEATYYVGSDMVRDLHDFCEADIEFMSLVCGTNEDNCSTTGLDMLEYLGAYRFGSEGSPFQVNFTTMEQLATAEKAEKICACDSTNMTGCFAPKDTRLESCAGTCGSLCAVNADDSRQYVPACYNNDSTLASDGLSTLSPASKIESLLSDLSSRAKGSSFAVLNYSLAVLSFFTATALALGFAYSTRYGKKKRQSVLSDPVNFSMGPAVLSLANLDRLNGIGRWDDWLMQHLKRWGDFVAMGNHPYYLILLALMFVVCCSSGLIRLEVETDSIKLWVSESSTVFQERSRFGEIFGPLDRVEQLVLTAKDGGAVTRSAYLKEAIRLQQIAENEITSGSVTLSDICIKDASASACQVNAVTQYFQNNMEHFEVYETYGLIDKHLRNCANAPERADVDVCSELLVRLNVSGSSLPTSMKSCPCVSSFGAPMTELKKYLGRRTVNDDSLDVNTYLQQATTLFSTAAVINYQDTAKNTDAIAWERAYIARMKKEAETNALYDISYAAETSTDDEFVVSASNMDIVFEAGIAGYIFVAVYVIVALNDWKLNRRFFHSSKIGVGLMGVTCILMAVVGTLGVFAWAGLKPQIVTLIVMPLVVFAIGTGNIFLILHAVDLKQDELKMEQQSLFVGLEDNDFGIHEITCVLLCEATGHVGPSLVLTAACECCTVAFAAYSAMPAAQWLAGSLVVGIAASVALQMTLFLAIVTLDKRRELSGTYDVICCKHASFACRPRLSEDENTTATESSSFPGSLDFVPDWNLIDRCVTGYVKVLLMKVSKVLVLLVFAVCTLVAIVSIEGMARGLSPTSFIPSSSYLHAYYRAVNDMDSSAKGFPVYFVVEAGYGSNPDRFNSLANDADAYSKLCSSKEVCSDLSIPNILNAVAADGDSNETYFKDGTVVGSWLDDFWGFIDPGSECCRVDPENGYSYSPLHPDDESSGVYVSKRASMAPLCLADASEILSVPQESFMSLFSMFSTAATGPLCPYAGGSRYHRQLSIDSQAIPAMSSTITLDVTLNGTGYGNDITAFAYKVTMSTAVDSSTISGSQEGAATAYSQAQYIAKWISEETGIDVWVYSPEYVFLDQFHSVRRTAYIVVGVGLAIVFVLQSTALGSYWYGFAVMFIAAVTVIQVAGLMMPMDVPLSSLSVVSLSVAVTFSVGFSGHFVRLFAKARTVTDDSGYLPAGDACVKKALTQLLVSWTLGIALSKFVAISALTLVATPVFAGYCFFRTLIAAAVCACLNNIVLLPVGLSISVDVTEGRVRDVKSTTEEGGVYSCESPSSSYHNAPLTCKYG